MKLIINQHHIAFSSLELANQPN